MTQKFMYIYIYIFINLCFIIGVDWRGIGSPCTNDIIACSIIGIITIISSYIFRARRANDSSARNHNPVIDTSTMIIF